MIIGISGKAQSGKDTVAKMWQYITDNLDRVASIHDFLQQVDTPAQLKYKPSWQIKKFADKVKEVTALITGCTVEDLENIDFKNSKLPDTFIKYGRADGFMRDDRGRTTMINKQCDVEAYKRELAVNWQTAYKTHLSYREALQVIGTDLFRDQFHEDTWVNALMKDYYIGDYEYSEMWMKENPGKSPYEPQYHNWLISDVRFPNEAKAIKDRGGVLIRVTRDFMGDDNEISVVDFENSAKHESETALDTYTFDHNIINNSSIDELLNDVEEIYECVKKEK